MTRRAGFSMLVSVPVKWLLFGLGCAIAITIWLGLAYRATTEWGRSATLLAQRRAEAAAESLLTALVRDMRAVQTSVLSAPWRAEFMSNPTSELQGVATAFARYPYPEVFFAANRHPTSTIVLFYSRAERMPGWLTRTEGRELPLMTIGHAPEVAERLLDRIAQDVARRQTFSAFDLQLDDVAYQVVNISFYKDGYREDLQSIFGFMVNLDWARERYFRHVVDQMDRSEDINRGLCFDVETSDGGAVVDGGCGNSTGPRASRTFPVTFFDPLLLSVYRPVDLVRNTWTIRASVREDAPLRTATTEARRILAVAVVAAIALTSALVLAARVARAETRVANMRSDFAAAVTHELKTPIATIQLVSERLASPRNTSIERSREYATLALQQSRRLRRLIDNLLAYNRIIEVTDAYSFELLEIRTLVEESLKEFAFQLEDSQVQVVVDTPAELIFVPADRTAMRLMLSNVIDNAIRYSGHAKYLRVSARAAGRFVTIAVTDHGTGISEQDLALVTRRFYRGPHSESGGSGLGLFIAQRIATDHHGTLTIQSQPGRGTTVEMSLPTGGDSR